MIDYRIKNNGGYTKTMGELVSMLEHTRSVTLEEIKDLCEEDLDKLVDGDINTIGTLLLHIASIEFVHGVISFEGRDINEVELQKWKAALELGEEAVKTIKGHPVQYYIDELSSVRETTLGELRKRSDDWLFEENEWPNGVSHNHYYLWFHVLEDEINHRGQMRSLKRRLLKTEEHT
ncbi:DinB family protein [Rossellomorea aquimaris]|uniref:DinB family protein n=1 Tax=Rossellomorea aquimaris TaxID=189382 RepID=UPI001CD2DD38|nr:DinB family protein [Rossellomorea aquimaris]MCA1060439.1 DinB family protein [Rossellomorea aquimaris]